MRHIFGYTTNDVTLSRWALHHAAVRPALRQAVGLELASWGVAYEQESHILVRKRPEVRGADPDALLAMIGDIRTNAFIAFAADAAAPSVSSVNTEPYRFRTWSMVTTGDFAGLDRRAATAALPQGLGQLVMGQTAAEVIFYRFVAALREEGVQLMAPRPPLHAVTKALADVLAASAAEAMEAGVEGPVPTAMLASNGRLMVAGSLGAPLAIYRFEGLTVEHREDIPMLRDRPPRLSQHDHYRGCVIASDTGGSDADGWEPIGAREVVGVNAEFEFERRAVTAPDPAPA